MPIRATAHLKCDYCGAEKRIDITRVPLGEHHVRALGAVYASHGFAVHGRTIICDAYCACFEDIFKVPQGR